MSGRRRLAVAGCVVGLAMWLGAASAWGDSLTPVCNGVPNGCNESGAWYQSSVSLAWQATPAPTKLVGCGSDHFTDVTTTVSCQVWWGTGGTPPTESISFPLNVETSTPTVSAVPSRPPDSNGWYNHPVASAVSGSSFSGIASCTPTTYAGPDTTNATVGGSCTDNAGKTASGTSLPFLYDASPPTIELADSTGDRIVVLQWTSMADIAPLASVVISRKPGIRQAAASLVYNGNGSSFSDKNVRNGVGYEYTLVATDQAGNSATQTLLVTPGPRLLTPARGAVVGAPPLLAWTPVRRAKYYNVQLYRGGRKILSAWPTGAGMQLRLLWRFDRRHYRLRPGRYRWFVWPGFGPRAAARYGREIGSSAFVVRRGS